MALSQFALVDTSVLARAHLPVVQDKLHTLIGLMVTCSILDLEIGYSARNHHDHTLVISQRLSLPLAPITQEICNRALEVQGLLAAQGHHRVPLSDLLIAACAEHHDLLVVHYDKDFDIIGQVTGQATQWVAARGSL